jgi:nicotinamidase-related amidase
VSNPRLRVLADLPQQPAGLSESILVLIDCQNTYTRGVMELEPVVVKNFPNAFVQTDLDAVLKTGNASNQVLAGFMTHMCVNSTARGALNLGYAPTVVAAATATRTLPGVGGELVPAEVLQPPAWPGSPTCSPWWCPAPPTCPTSLA